MAFYFYPCPTCGVIDMPRKRNGIMPAGEEYRTCLHCGTKVKRHSFKKDRGALK